MPIKEKLINITNNKSLLNGAMFSGFSFINRGFSFLLLLILANYITPAEYGYLSLFSTVVMVVSYFMAMSTEGYMSVAFFKEGEEGIKNTFSCILATSLISLIVFGLIIAIGGEKLASLLELPQNILYLSIAISFFTVFTNVNLDYIRLREKVKTYGIYSCGNAFLNFVLSIILIKTFLLGWEGRVYAQTFCFTLFGIIGLITFIGGGYLRMPDRAYWKKMLIWGVPLIPHLATAFIRQGFDRYIINYYHTIDDVGLFSFALTLANIVTMIGHGFNQSNSVDIYKILGDKTMSNQTKLEKINAQIRLFIRAYIFITVLVTAIGYFAFPLLLPKYSPAMNYFAILAIYGFLVCMYLVYTNYLFYYNETKTLMYITFGSSVLHLILSLFLTKYSLYITASLYGFTQLLVVLLVKRKALKLIQSNIP